MAPAVGAVVVSYNSERHLPGCLDTLRAEGVSPVVVADNGSSDRSLDVAAAKGAVWLPTGGNLGYGRAANLAAAHPALDGHTHLIVCNPDTEVRPGSVERLVAAIEADPSIGVVGPRIVNPDGSLYPSARTFPDMVDAMGHGLLGQVVPDNPFTRRYRMLDWDHAAAARVDWVSGAFLLVRRPAWIAVGGFDPAYFMYMEDVDLCWRLQRAGWGVAYEPAAEVVHVQGVSADLHPYRMMAAHHRSMWTFARRSLSGGRRAALPVVAVGLLGRLGVATARRRLDGSAGRLGPEGLAR
jgi:N-acetylglucosaminyl-diphospho-decaprenol L-rhamnosyltransferase